MIAWMRRRREAGALANADAEALLLRNGRDAYAEARRRERVCLIGRHGAHDPHMRSHWRRVAKVIARRAS